MIDSLRKHAKGQFSRAEPDLATLVSFWLVLNLAFCVCRTNPSDLEWKSAGNKVVSCATQRTTKRFCDEDISGYSIGTYSRQYRRDIGWAYRYPALVGIVCS